MSLREYRRKRDFRRTPEPSGGAAADGPGRGFVVQKHDASRLHYDFRLELDGTLKSWAVPKGPSLDPRVKSLAVHVEDHPLDYADFEGVIPPGEYGGGTVMVWDRGTWEPEGDPREGYRRGRLKFRLHGEKLHGGWALVRMSGQAGEDGKNWLLLKHDDEAARSAKRFDVLKRAPLSVISNRDLDAIAAASDRVWQVGRSGKKVAVAVAKQLAPGKAPKRRRMQAVKIAGAKKAAQPTTFKPQLATLAREAPVGPAWIHELKFDGYRILAFIARGQVRLVSRNGLDWTHRFPTIAAAVGQLPINQAILDGEVVSLNKDGISDFQKLQSALRRGDDGSLVYYVFDLPHCDGYDLSATPLVERKTALAKLLAPPNRRNSGVVRYSDHVASDGSTVLEHACRSHAEGIICKRADACYEQARSRSWLKVKCVNRQELVIVGYTRPEGSRIGLGALLLGYYQGSELKYAGRVGTGFADATLRELSRRLAAIKVRESPVVAALSASQRRGVSWVRPELVAEVEFTEWTDEGLLRHPSFQGLREDKSARQVVREKAGPMPRAQKTAKTAAPRGGRMPKQAPSVDNVVAGVTITHPDRVLYPEAGVTKLELARYYEQVAEWILPHVTNRPLTLVRCPAGHGKPCFYQKHLTESLPEAVRGVMIQEKTDRDEYLAIDDVQGLVALVQLGVLEFHPWPARADKVEAPDRLVLDLDPGEGISLRALAEAARDIRTRLGELGLESFLRTSGGKGLHVVAPLARRQSWEQLKSFAKAFAEDLAGREPDRFIATMTKAKRRGKIYVDYLRNQRGATAIASYSTRARAGAPVATPLAWDELTARTKPDGFTVANLPQRLATLKADPWKGFFNLRQSITRAMFAELGAG